MLVAVGVVDILPSCLSSKYFFWDPDLAHLSLGRLSALKEIQWIAAAHTVCPSFRYYYMGYYIHVRSSSAIAFESIATVATQDCNIKFYSILKSIQHYDY